MHCSKAFVLTGAALLGICLPTSQAHCGRWGVGIGIGFPGYWGPGWGGYYRAYPVYYAPPPVYVQPVQVVQPYPVAQPVYQAAPLPPAPVPASTPPPPLAPVAATSLPVANSRGGEVERNLQLLRDPEDRTRADAVIQLGRMKARTAIDPLAATLAGDRSPIVREAAARALGVIGSPQSLPALNQAAQADTDRNVRYSAQFAIDVIQAR
jgi:hypothetical protein